MADNMDLKEKIPEQEEKEEVENEIPEQEEKRIAMEIFGELKTQNKRLITVLFVVLSLWAATIGGFIWYLNQYDFSSYSVESNDGGNANYIGNDGDIVNGEGEGYKENQEKREIEGNGN